MRQRARLATGQAATHPDTVLALYAADGLTPLVSNDDTQMVERPVIVDLGERARAAIVAGLEQSGVTVQSAG